MENREEMRRRIAWLESRLDQVETEMGHINQLLLDCGFPEGIHTLKVTIEDLLEEAGEMFRPPEDPPMTQTFDPFG